MKQKTHTLLSSMIATALCLLSVFVFTKPVLGDDVRINGFWIRHVEVSGITDGMISYIVNGSEISKPIKQLQGMKLESYPQVDATYRAIAAKKYKKALSQITQVVAKARDPWLKQFAMSIQIVLFDQVKRPSKAVRAYLKLISLKPDPELLKNAPLQSIAQTPDAKKKDIARWIKRKLRTTDENSVAYPLLQKMLKLAYVAPHAKQVASRNTSTAATKNRSSTTRHSSSATYKATNTALSSIIQTFNADNQDAIKSIVPLSRALDASDPITRDLASGKFEKVITEVNRRLAGNERKMAMRLYQKGIAQLYLAEKTTRESDYKDAALSLMRVAIYFSKSSYAGPSLLEVAYIHEKIGKPNLALKLYRKASLSLDSEIEPELTQRLETLTGQSAQ